MINNSENGHHPEIQDTEADPAQQAHTSTAVAEPDAHVSQPIETRPEQPSASNPEMSAQTVTPMTEPAPPAQAAGNGSMASADLPAATKPVSEAELSSELTQFRRSFEEIQAEFIGGPRAAVDKAEELINGRMEALDSHLLRIHNEVKTETDTEQLRVAMLSYRELFKSLGGRRAE